MPCRPATCLAALLVSAAQATGAGAAPPPPVEQASANPDPSNGVAAADPLILADDALQGRRLFEAQMYLDLLAADPRPEALLLRAELALLRGRPHEALALLARPGADSTPVCRTGAAAAMALLQVGRAEQASARSEALDSRCSADPFHWRTRGRISYARRDIPGALAAFRQALALQPSDPGIENDLAVSLIAAGDAEQAAGMLTELLRQAPEASDVSLNLDFANAMRGIEPVRRPQDDDQMWSIRLEMAGQGARQARRIKLAESLLARALLNRPRHDDALWQQYAEVAGRDD
jgi:Flp pilus assembly protein TadD